MTGEELRTRRKRLGVTQTELAKMLGVTGNTIARWERDEVAPPSLLGLALEALENRRALVPREKTK